MPVKRRVSKRAPYVITPEVIATFNRFRAGDIDAGYDLNALLSIAPWQWPAAWNPEWTPPNWEASEAQISLWHELSTATAASGAASGMGRPWA